MIWFGVYTAAAIQYYNEIRNTNLYPTVSLCIWYICRYVCDCVFSLRHSWRLDKLKMVLKSHPRCAALLRLFV